MVRDEPPPAPIGGRARAGQGHCDLCYFPDAREDSGVVICPHAIVCVRARNRRRKILALISVLIILGQDALTKCGSKERGESRTEQLTRGLGRTSRALPVLQLAAFITHQVQVSTGLSPGKNGSNLQKALSTMTMKIHVQTRKPPEPQALVLGGGGRKVPAGMLHLLRRKQHMS